MPILATGTDRSPLRAQPGFTLVELLIVLVILGLVSGAAMLTFSGAAGRLSDASQQLSDLVNEAEARAITSGRTTGLVVTEHGASVMTRAQDQWIPVAGLTPVAWPEGADVIFERNGTPVALAPEALTPVIYFSSVGEVTPFILRFRDGDVTAEVSRGP